MLPKVLLGFTGEKENFFEKENLSDNFALSIDASETNLSEFREWVNFCQNVLDETGLYFMIIWNAGELSPECQAVLLKPLEEKKPKTKMFLMVDKETDLLPTITSRCSVEVFQINTKTDIYWTEMVKKWREGAGAVIDFCEKIDPDKLEELLNETILKIKLELQKQVNPKRVAIMNIALEILEDIHNTNVNKKIALESFMLRSLRVIVSRQ